jgi:hypothetical protein
MSDLLKKTKDLGFFWTVLFVLPIVVASVPLAALYHGFVLAKLWAWFGEPMFGRHLDIYHAAGLTMIVRFAVWPQGVLGAMDTKWAGAVFGPLIMLGVGALWHWLGWGIG